MKLTMKLMILLLLPELVQSQVRKIDTITFKTKGLYFKVKPDSSIIIKGDTIKAFRYLLDEIHDMDARIDDMANNYRLFNTTAAISNVFVERDTVIKHQQKVSVLVMISFDRNEYQWLSAWQCWDEKKCLNCNYFITGYSSREYYYLTPDKKKRLKQPVIDFRIIK